MIRSPSPGRKESAKQRRERLQFEADERNRFAREQLCNEESTARTIALTQAESIDWLSLSLRFREEQVALMVDRRFYNQLIDRIEQQSNDHVQQRTQLEEELRRVRQAKTTLEDELKEIRLDHKLQTIQLPKKIKELEAGMMQAVQKAIRTLEEEKEKDAKAVLHGLNWSFGHHKQLYLDMLYEAQQKLRHFSQVLIESKSMHTNLPVHIKRQLEQCSKEDLLFMLDALSFEETVLEYLETRFPKPQPQRFATHDTPTGGPVVIKNPS
eukprot:TRINITY_DN9769_c0_g1_i1.p1 TRINITY_DN9769_c0_g1~~TRINITY_DN9769_c0_g1_i1.p1  ORF type:complete len:268 (+),score=67.27 TRINITY_DN9769_c0_g1_i1:55-858(+)